MIVSVASHKGGVGKTTTAIHLAAYLQNLAPTLLLDGDKLKSAIDWNDSGEGLPFRVAPVSQAAKLGPEFAGGSGHIVLDTGQRQEGDDLREAAEGCDVLVITSAPNPMDTRGLVKTIQALRGIGMKNYRVLLTKVPPGSEREVALIRTDLEGEGIPMFTVEIPRLKEFEKASGIGVIVDKVGGRNAARAWEAYQNVGKELTL